jgi:hypothetical protein
LREGCGSRPGVHVVVLLAHYTKFVRCGIAALPDIFPILTTSDGARGPHFSTSSRGADDPGRRPVPGQFRATAQPRRERGQSLDHTMIPNSRGGANPRAWRAHRGPTVPRRRPRVDIGTLARKIVADVSDIAGEQSTRVGVGACIHRLREVDDDTQVSARVKHVVGRLVAVDHLASQHNLDVAQRLFEQRLGHSRG